MRHSYGWAFEIAKTPESPGKCYNLAMNPRSCPRPRRALKDVDMPTGPGPTECSKGIAGRHPERRINGI
jgi:hypothetical protein